MSVAARPEISLVIHVNDDALAETQRCETLSQMLKIPPSLFSKHTVSPAAAECTAWSTGKRERA
jgi:hypothetical protein